MIFQFIILILFCFTILSIKTKKYVFVGLTIILSLFVNFQILSYSLGGSLIDYKFYLHLKIIDLQTLKYYPIETRNSIIAIISTFLIFYFSGKKLQHTDLISSFKKLRNILAALLFLLTFLPNGISTSIITISKILTAKDVKFNDALKNLGIEPTTYTSPLQVKAKAGKNIIILSLESLEKGFITSSKLSEVTPFLRKLKNENSFYEMNQIPGAAWTAGSLYTFLTGTPCYFKELGDKMLKNSKSTQITGLSHILSAAQYNMTYIIGSPHFANITDILKTYNIPYKAEKEFKENYPHTPFGPYDQYLFKEAKIELLNLKAQEKPFCLFLSSINTHAPDGFIDPEGEKRIPKQKSNLETMVRSLDYDISLFFDFLKKENLLENTVFYIFPDHLLMSQNARAFDDFESQRGLYLLTNASADDLHHPLSKKINQTDLTNILLNGSQIKHNASFFADYIPDGISHFEFIKNNEQIITEFNNAGIIK